MLEKIKTLYKNKGLAKIVCNIENRKQQKEYIENLSEEENIDLEIMRINLKEKIFKMEKYNKIALMIATSIYLGILFVLCKALTLDIMKQNLNENNILQIFSCILICTIMLIVWGLVFYTSWIDSLASKQKDVDTINYILKIKENSDNI